MRFLAIAALALVVACDSATSPEEAILGTWGLQTVNGAPLPATVFGLGLNSVQITSGTITFASDGTYSSTLATRTTINGTATNTTNTQPGTYTVTGTTISVSVPGQTTTESGTISGGTLTTTLQGYAVVFAKQ